MINSKKEDKNNINKLERIIKNKDFLKKNIKQDIENYNE
jgi:hypothetical protein